VTPFALRASRLVVGTLLVLAIGVGVGFAAVWLFAPDPTIWNSSPPPEPFLFVEGFVSWLVVFAAGRTAYRRHRRRRFANLS
jgi:hypothetical protein